MVVVQIVVVVDDVVVVGIAYCCAVEELRMDLQGLLAGVAESLVVVAYPSSYFRC